MSGSNGRTTVIRPKRFRSGKAIAKKNAPGQGRKVSVDQYNDLYAAYVRTGDVVKSAHEAGVTPETARRYIQKGSADFPAIVERLALVNRRAFEDQDDALVRQRRMFQEAAMEVGAELIQALKQAKLSLSGKDLRDAAGNVVRSQDGSPVRVINETTLGTAIGVLQKLQETIDRSTASIELVGRGGDIHISNTQITVGPDAAEAAVEGEALLKQLGLARALSVGTPEEKLLRSAIAKEASRRASDRAQDIIDVTPGNVDSD